ncbi:hypothetical protein GJ496_006760 [Pomphorhynchus laevis]|nr:hypothetical protein GJ496_006760 [Pomphorhynchus laevis]
MKYQVSSDTGLYQCPQCETGFVWSSSLQRHLREIHHLKNTALCNYCGKLFKRRTSLAAHMRYHRPLQCPMMQCVKEFKRIANLQVHLRKQHGSVTKCVLCKQCDTAFISVSLLNEHLEKAHDNGTERRIKTNIREKRIENSKEIIQQRQHMNPLNTYIDNRFTDLDKDVTVNS